MLDKLRAKLPVDIAENVLVVEGTAEDSSELESGSFDGVSVLLAFFDMARPQAALREAIRVLRPGGTVIMTEPRRRFNLQELLDEGVARLREREDWNTLKDDWERVTHANIKLNPKGENEWPNREERGARLWAEDIEEILRDHGFESIHIRESHLGNCATIQGKRAK
jgi:ubiquinone/menaquinone biosynthesis C-methylase UbiE